MDGIKKETDISETGNRKGPYQTMAAPASQLSDETIGSLMAECKELEQQIDDEKDRLERFMLETGGESDASDRIQGNIGSLKKTLSAAESRLQVLFDAQEKEAFPQEEKAMYAHEAIEGRVSVIQRLAEKKAKSIKGKLHEMENGKNPSGKSMER